MSQARQRAWGVKAGRGAARRTSRRRPPPRARANASARSAGCDAPRTAGAPGPPSWPAAGAPAAVRAGAARRRGAALHGAARRGAATRSPRCARRALATHRASRRSRPSRRARTPRRAAPAATRSWCAARAAGARPACAVPRPPARRGALRGGAGGHQLGDLHARGRVAAARSRTRALDGYASRSARSCAKRMRRSRSTATRRRAGIANMASLFPTFLNAVNKDGSSGCAKNGVFRQATRAYRCSAQPCCPSASALLLDGISTASESIPAPPPPQQQQPLRRRVARAPTSDPCLQARSAQPCCSCACGLLLEQVGPCSGFGPPPLAPPSARLRSSGAAGGARRSAPGARRSAHLEACVLGASDLLFSRQTFLSRSATTILSLRDIHLTLPSAAA